MWTLGIDVAKYRHNATLLNESGKAIFRNLSFTNDMEGLEILLSKISATGQAFAGIVVGMEATGHYWLLLFHHLVERGFEVKLINPIVTRARRNITVRGNKTDAADSLLIARLLREADVKVSAIPSEEVNNLRALTRLRFECSQEAIAEKLRLISLLDIVFPEYKNHFTDIFGATSRELLSLYPTAEQIAKIDIRRLTSLLEKASRGKLGRKEALKLKQSARRSFGCIGSNQTLIVEIRMTVERLNLILSHIKELDRAITSYFVEQQRLLMTIPGIATVWAPTILAEVLPVYDPDRRDGGASFVAMAGLDPRLRDSGQSKGKAHMSKRGSKYLRTAVRELITHTSSFHRTVRFRSHSHALHSSAL